MGSIPNYSKSYLEIMTESQLMKGKVVSVTTKCLHFMRSLTLNADHPFYVLDLGVVASLMERWAHSLPEYRPFYAVKCNPDPTLLASLAAMGSGFDCASRAEIEAVLALGVSPERIIFANPCKLSSDIEFAATAGVNLTTFDSISELHKIRKLHPRSTLLLRIKPPIESGAVRPLGFKYGALQDEVETLLCAALKYRLAVAGVSFHVGSAATNPNSYSASIAAAKKVFDAAENLGMPHMSVLNVGGGFFAVDDIFEEASTAINSAVSEHFGSECKEGRLSLMAEPGRFFVESAFSLAVKIVGKRARGEEREYWINDGIYGSFLGRVVTGTGNGISDLTCVPLFGNNNACKETEAATWFESTVFGPTCDSLDTVVKGHRLPEMEVGDWLGFPDMGAYCYVFKSNFNGFHTTPCSTFAIVADQ